MSDDVKAWLEGLDLGKYHAVFAENEITLRELPDLEENDLVELGLPMGPRKRLMRAIADMTDEGETVEAARRQVTVLFADISGYTRLSSGLDAEETHALLNSFFTAVDAVVRNYGGTIDKHIGDAVMAVFGAPVAHTDDPERALRAALDIHEAAAALETPMKVHAGVASGQVVASVTGSDAHTEFTVTGDSVNLASRLTDQAKSGETFVSDSVQRALGERFEGDNLGERPVAGLPEPVTVWRLAGLAEAGMEMARQFVGRRKELSEFSGALENCLRTGKGETFIVRGEAGIGKTHLLGEFERLARERGFAAHTGLVLDFGAGKGQDAIRALVRSLLGIAPGSSKDARALARDEALANGLIDSGAQVHLNDLLDLEQPADLRSLYDAMDNAVRNKGKQDTVDKLIASLSQNKALLIRLEDFHWAEQAILDYAATLASQVVQCPAVMVLTTRLSADPFDVDWRTSLGETPIRQMDLGPLENEDALHLAHEFDDIGEDLIEACVERSGGNPLFLEQLLRNAVELSATDIPGSVQGIVQARLDVLAAEDRSLIQAAAVLGQRFSGEAVKALLDSDTFDITRLMQNGLVDPVGQDFHFKHALIRDGVYASLLKARRVELHGRAAAWFADNDAILYAEHLDRAEDDGAVAAYLAAASEQHGLRRYLRALNLVDRALELEGTRELRLTLTCMQGDLRRDLAQVDASLQSFEAAIELAASDAEGSCAQIGLAEGMRLNDRAEEGAAALDAAQAHAEAAGIKSDLAHIHYLRGNYLFPLGQFDRCMEEHAKVADYGREIGDIEFEARGEGGLGDANYLRGRMITAGRHFERCLKLARAIDLKSIEVANLPMLAATKFYSLNLKDSLNDTLNASKQAQSIGRRREAIVALNGAGYMLFELDRIDEAEEQTRVSISFAEEIGAQRFLAINHGYLARIELRRGNRQSAYESARKAVDLAIASGSSFCGPWSMAPLIAASPYGEIEPLIEEAEKLLAEGAVSHNHFFSIAI